MLLAKNITTVVQGTAFGKLKLIVWRRYSTELFERPITVLFFSSILPQPNSSAAGVRTTFLLEKLAQTDNVKSIHYVTGAKLSLSETQSDLEQFKGVKFHQVAANNSRGMKLLLDDIGMQYEINHPAQDMLVIMDRFYCEEAYSFHIHKRYPEAALVLDMQDMHSLRWHRQKIVETRDKLDNNGARDYLSNLSLTDFPVAYDINLQRELASIHRSDLTLVCSPVEKELLESVYQVPKQKLCLAPFFVQDVAPSSESLDYDSRKDFVFVGGFRHDPNVDALRQMKRLWPRIRTLLGDDTINFHVYGPFCPDPLRKQCHDPSQGFILHGLTGLSIQEILHGKRAMLAPIRYGAGIKGKIVDAWTFGATPVVTTSIGCEGMTLYQNQAIGPGDIRWGGLVEDTSDGFVHAAASLYDDKLAWQTAHDQCHHLVTQLYSGKHWKSTFASLVEVTRNIKKRRQSDYFRGILWQQQNRSTEYFSRWVELKNK